MRARTHRTESAWGWGLVLSVGLHGGLVVLAVLGGVLAHYLPLGGAHPGTAPEGAVTASLVNQIPGGAIPMPSPTEVATKNRLASDTTAPGISRPAAHAAAKNSVALPSHQMPDLARQQALREYRSLARADQQKDDQRVHYGNGGAASFNYTQSKTGNSGAGGVAFGDAAFGSLYTEWVNHLKDRLSFYWNMQSRDPSVPTGRPVTVSFVVHQDGGISDMTFQPSSRIADLDGMALHSVQQLAYAEKLPLPAGYNHSTLSVKVTFELQ